MYSHYELTGRKVKQSRDFSLFAKHSVSFLNNEQLFSPSSQVKEIQSNGGNLQSGESITTNYKDADGGESQRKRMCEYKCT